MFLLLATFGLANYYPLMTIPEESNDLKCDICKAVVQIVQHALTDTPIESVITKKVNDACGILPGDHKALCQKMASHIPTILDWIEQGLNVVDICDLLGVCDEANAPLAKDLPVRRLEENGFPQIRIPINLPANLGCNICKNVVNIVEIAMGSTDVVDEIVELAKTGCEEVPEIAVGLCKAIATEFVPRIMNYIEQGMDTWNICNKIGVCKSSNTLASELPIRKLDEENAIACKAPHRLLIGISRVVSQAPSVTCSACKAFLNWVNTELEEIDAAKLKNLLDSKCPNIPIVKSVCEMITEDNIDFFVDLLQEKVSSNTSCQWLKFC